MPMIKLICLRLVYRNTTVRSSPVETLQIMIGELNEHERTRSFRISATAMEANEKLRRLRDSAVVRKTFRIT